MTKTPLFTLRVALSTCRVTIRAFEGPWTAPNHTTLYCELRSQGKVLFPAQQFTVGIPSHHTIDGKVARDTVMSLFALKPGDTDADFFSHYTPEQLDFVTCNGEELSCIAAERYGERQ